MDEGAQQEEPSEGQVPGLQDGQMTSLATHIGPDAQHSAITSAQSESELNLGVQWTGAGGICYRVLLSPIVSCRVGRYAVKHAAEYTVEYCAVYGVQ